MNCKYVLMAALLAILVPDVCAKEYVVNSPDGQISASFDVKNGTLFYSVSKEGMPVVGSSSVEIFAGAKMMVDDHSVRENDSSWEPIWGQFSTIRDHHRELTLSMTADGIPVKLLCRVFDTGVGFRFAMSEESKGKEMTFFNEYKPLGAVAHYSGERGIEVSPQGETSFGAVPLVTKREDGLHVAFLESDLYSASGFELMKVQSLEADKSFTASSSTVSNGQGQVTAWRTILIEETAGDLAVNTVALNLAAPNKLEDTSWIEPGRGLWDWRVHGYDNGDFIYGIDTRSYLRFIDFCAEHGIKYFTVDSGWYTSARDGNMTVSPEVDIDKVMNYAEEKGVKVLLYYDRHKGNFGDDKLFSHYAGLGATGIKYGFMGNRAEFTRKAMEAAAENELLINFHDNPVPMAGVERTMPNLITREYCHAQQDYREAFTPETFLRMAMVSSLSGPLDMSNGNFGINGINAGEREKGPREKTATSQQWLARWPAPW